MSLVDAVSVRWRSRAGKGECRLFEFGEKAAVNVILCRTIKDDGSDSCDKRTEMVSKIRGRWYGHLRCGEIG
jgi:hypothetical protein